MAVGVIPPVTLTTSETLLQKVLLDLLKPTLPVRSTPGGLGSTLKRPSPLMPTSAMNTDVGPLIKSYFDTEGDYNGVLFVWTIGPRGGPVSPTG